MQNQPTSSDTSSATQFRNDLEGALLPSRRMAALPREEVFGKKPEACEESGVQHSQGAEHEFRTKSRRAQLLHRSGGRKNVQTGDRQRQRPTSPSGPSRGYLVRRLFEPLDDTVELEGSQLDDKFPEWCESPYVSLTISGTLRLQNLLTHLYVLIPVLDNEKHVAG